MMGWWGVTSLLRTPQCLLENRAELSRALSLDAIGPDATDEQVQLANAERLRATSLHDAASRITWGSAIALFGVCLVACAPEPGEGALRTWWFLVSWALVGVGALVLWSGVRGRRELAALTAEEILAMMPADGGAEAEAVDAEAPAPPSRAATGAPRSPRAAGPRRRGPSGS